MTDNPSEPRMALPDLEQLAILVTFSAGAKYGINEMEIAERYLEQSRDDNVQLAWQAFRNELKLGGSFAAALAATGFISKDVQRILNILKEVEPATEAAIAYLSVVTRRDR